MIHPSYALQAALVAALRADVALAALLGGPKIYESAPPDIAPPWVAFDDISARANDAVNMQGHLHRMTLRCVSDQPGTQECSAIAARVHDILGSITSALNGHTVINLDVTEMALQRAGKIPRRVMVVTLRAMTQQQP